MKASLKQKTAGIIMTLLLFMGCDRTPKTHETTDDQGKTHFEAKPFEGQVYRTHDNSSSINLISPEELEFRSKGTIFLCKYSKQQDGMRVILNANGSQQVLYFRSFADGLRTDDGAVFLSSNSYNLVQKTKEETRRREEQEQLAEQKRQQDAMNAKREAQERLQKRLDESTRITKEIATYTTYTGTNLSEVKVIVTDVSIKLIGEKGWNDNYPFLKLTYITPYASEKAHIFIVDDHDGKSWHHPFKNVSDANKFIDDVQLAYDAWVKRFTDVAKERASFYKFKE